MLDMGGSWKRGLKEEVRCGGLESETQSFGFVGSFVHQIPLSIWVLPAFVSQEGAAYFAWPPVLPLLGHGKTIHSLTTFLCFCFCFCLFLFYGGDITAWGKRLETGWRRSS